MKWKSTGFYICSRGYSDFETLKSKFEEIMSMFELNLSKTELLKTEFGLWKTCEKTALATLVLCADVPVRCKIPGARSACKKISIIKGFLTTACVVSGLCALALLVCGIAREDSNRAILLISKALLFLSFTVELIAVAVGLSFMTDALIRFKIGVSAIMGIIAVTINGIVTLMAILMIR